MHHLLRRNMIKNAALCDEKGGISLFFPLKFPPSISFLFPLQNTQSFYEMVGVGI